MLASGSAEGVSELRPHLLGPERDADCERSKLLAAGGDSVGAFGHRLVPAAAPSTPRLPRSTGARDPILCLPRN
jgi:hypothetical protein